MSLLWFGPFSTLNDIGSFLMTATVSLFHGSYVQVREFQILNQSVFNVCIFLCNSLLLFILDWMKQYLGSLFFFLFLYLFVAIVGLRFWFWSFSFTSTDILICYELLIDQVVFYFCIQSCESGEKRYRFLKIL